MRFASASAGGITPLSARHTKSYCLPRAFAKAESESLSFFSNAINKASVILDSTNAPQCNHQFVDACNSLSSRPRHGWDQLDCAHALLSSDTKVAETQSINRFRPRFNDPWQSNISGLVQS